MLRLTDSIEIMLKNEFETDCFITTEPIEKLTGEYRFSDNYSATDTSITLLLDDGELFIPISEEIIGKTIELDNGRIKRVIADCSGSNIILESGFGVDVLENDGATIKLGNYIIITKVNNGETLKLDDYLNLYSRYILEIGSESKSEIEDMEIRLQYLFKDISYPLYDDQGVVSEINRFYVSDALDFDVYVDLKGNYINKGFIRFEYQIIR